ncbi:unnamed protein product [Effrenium voratum]|uniref:Ectoine hydroxylase n=1 Tax=Effrenium voratum TaxID=2562239 RepID=A0AA36MVJ7_9DINO|nr:unnamed protein product [Effrenium voratum]CAJ1456753.1 unnamed protein product [Effrenium voratum]
MADVQGYTPAEPQVPFEPYRTRCEDAEVAVRPDPTVWGPVSSELGTFDEQGCCVLRNVVPPERIEACRKYLATFTSEEQLKVTDNCRLVTEANSSVLRSVFAVHEAASANLAIVCNAPLHFCRTCLEWLAGFCEDDGSPLAELARSDLITRHVQQILADDVYVHQSRVNLQAPFKGTGFSWHSDFETWHAEDGMPKPRSLSAVIFLDKNAEHNGALMVIPGSHKSFLRCSGRQKNANWEKSLQSQVYGTPSEDHIRQLAEKQGIKHCVGEAGDVLFFDSNLLHASSGNRSPFSRRNLFVAFNSWTNRLQAPFYAEEKRPEHVAHRERITRCDRTP